MKELLRLVKLFLPVWPRLMAATGFSFLTIAGNIGLLAASAVLISRAALQPPILDLMMLIVAVRFFGISRGVFRYLERNFSHDLTFRLLSQIRTNFYAALEPLAPACLAAYHSGDLFSRIVSDVEILKDFYLRVLGPPLTAILVLGGSGIFLAWFDPRIAVVLVFWFLMAGIAVPMLIGRLSQPGKKQGATVKAELNAYLMDSIQGMSDVLAYGQEDARRLKAAHLGQNLAGWQEKMAGLNGLTAAAGQLVMNLAMWSALVLAIPLVSRGSLPGIYLAMLALVVLSSFEAALPLPVVFSYLAESRAAAGRLWQIIDTRPAVSDTGDPLLQPEDYAIQVRDLSFRYGPELPWVIKDLSFSLAQGGKMAIVGASGAGKSTLTSLLLRFWEYPAGSIRIGGHEIRDYQPEDLRRMFAVVAQETHLFNTTIRENLILARPGASEAEIHQAAGRAEIHEFILSLPEAYETIIGEGGFKLSGGQRQRLAIARAFLKDAPILILDEATANLDMIAQQEIMATMEQLMQGKTTILISHQLSVVQQMDQIVVLA